MSLKIKQVGYRLGDKLSASIANLKIGELRYYTCDNPNIYDIKEIKSSKSLFESFFEDYIVILKDKEETLIERIVYKDTFFKDVVANKGYLCVMEATEEHNGVGLEISDGHGYIYKEKYNYQK